MESAMSFLAILAKVLKPAPGNHSGTYLTGKKQCKILWESLFRPEVIRMGKESTRKVPDTMATSIVGIAFSYAEKNLSFSDSTFTPYVIDKLKDEMRLPGQNVFREPETAQRSSEN